MNTPLCTFLFAAVAPGRFTFDISHSPCFPIEFPKKADHYETIKTAQFQRTPWMARWRICVDLCLRPPRCKRWVIGLDLERRQRKLDRFGQMGRRASH